MISRNVEMVENTSAAALAAIAYYDQTKQKQTLVVAATLAKSAGHQLMAVKGLYESLVLAIDAHHAGTFKESVTFP